MASRESQIAVVRKDLRRNDPELADRWEQLLPVQEALELYRRQQVIISQRGFSFALGIIR